MPPPVQETSVRQLLQTVRRYVAFLLRYWYVPLLVGGLVAAAYYLRERGKPVRYVSTVTFVVNGEKGGGMGLGAVLGQFGLGGASAGGENLERVMAFASSRYLINRMLLDTVTVGGRADLLGNHLIEQEELADYWDWEGEEYTGPRRLSGSDMDALERRERGLLRRLYGYLLLSEAEPLQRDIREETGVLSLEARARDEELALHLSLGLYDYLSAFYTQESSGQAQATVDLLQAKADSIRAELNSAEYRLAANYDTRQSLGSQRDQLRRSQLSREVQILSLAYTELVRNLETAKFSLSTSKPYFQPVDLPFDPLPMSYPNAVKAGLTGLGIGVVLACVVLALINFYREVMNDPA